MMTSDEFDAELADLKWQADAIADARDEALERLDAARWTLSQIEWLAHEQPGPIEPIGVLVELRAFTDRMQTRVGETGFDLNGRKRKWARASQDALEFAYAAVEDIIHGRMRTKEE